MFNNFDCDRKFLDHKCYSVGIALIGVGGALGFDLGMVAGAVISGAYFGINYLYVRHN
jgi:hypothetical protein